MTIIEQSTMHAIQRIPAILQDISDRLGAIERILRGERKAASDGRKEE